MNWDSGQYDLDDASSYMGTTLDLINISKGTAKNIKLKLSIDNLKSFIEEIIKRQTEWF